MAISGVSFRIKPIGAVKRHVLRSARAFCEHRQVLPAVDFAFGRHGESELVAVAVTEEAVGGEGWKRLDESLSGELTSLTTESLWDATKTVSGRISTVGSARRLLVHGLGKRSTVAAGAWQAFCQSAGVHAREKRVESVSLQLLGENLPAHAIEALAAGIHVGIFDDLRFKSKLTSAKPLCAVQLVTEERIELTNGVGLGTALASGTILARKLVNSPANVCTPTHLAKTALALAAAHPDVLSCRILDRAECQARGMGAFLGVAAASAEPPAFIHLTYTPLQRDAAAPVLALVGKGLTFDSGGYNIKAGAGSMIEMCVSACVRQRVFV
jgi:leucyl aminopeptidase